ncbi:MAG TPA: thioredoxin domain-containing protein [Candidatus Goldiibacteriota bacterium]|nr:thioredoxin domain-containing protein [Candidatus Goldiibacteriota bacterium]HPN64161.1 thioredoxin domain-containing protein [Candidatus Goldiibacteriota bacterium]HRQ43164.1 thioredoxin domain-containing protein [Candidatus Goldiibacteriota bacterium]
MKKRLFLFCLAAAAVFMIFACSKTPEKFKVTIIEKFDSHCGSCALMNPIIAQVEKKYKGTVKIIKYDLGKPEDYEASKIYNIDRIPAFVFLDENGNEFFRNAGVMDLAQIENLLKQQGISVK